MSEANQPIQLVVIDLDGTLLNSQHQMTDRTAETIRKAKEAGVKVVLATGKTHTSARDIIKRLELDTPGIYVQGLAIYGGDGTLSYQQTLEPEVARQVLTYAEERGFSIVAYSGDRLLTRTLTSDVEKMATDYHEPMPEDIGPLQNVLDEVAFNKLLIIKQGDAKRIKALRWQLERQLDGRGKLVQTALPDMLEVMPNGGSKGTALRVILRDLKIDTANVLAIGDGENDIELLQMAGYGVAMKNANDKLKAVAGYTVASNDEDGVAEALERFVLSSQAAQTTSEGDTGSASEKTEDESQSAEASQDAASSTEAASDAKSEDARGGKQE